MGFEVVQHLPHRKLASPPAVHAAVEIGLACRVGSAGVSSLCRLVNSIGLEFLEDESSFFSPYKKPYLFESWLEAVQGRSARLMFFFKLERERDGRDSAAKGLLWFGRRCWWLGCRQEVFDCHMPVMQNHHGFQWLTGLTNLAIPAPRIVVVGTCSTTPGWSCRWSSSCLSLALGWWMPGASGDICLWLLDGFGMERMFRAVLKPDFERLCPEALIGVIVERTTAAQQNMTSLEEEARVQPFISVHVLPGAWRVARCRILGSVATWYHFSGLVRIEETLHLRKQVLDPKRHASCQLLTSR